MTMSEREEALKAFVQFALQHLLELSGFFGRVLHAHAGKEVFAHLDVFVDHAGNGRHRDFALGIGSAMQPPGHRFAQRRRIERSRARILHQTLLPRPISWSHGQGGTTLTGNPPYSIARIRVRAFAEGVTLQTVRFSVWSLRAIMVNSRIVTAARTAVVGACIAIASVPLVSACSPAAPSTTIATGGTYGKPPATAKARTTASGVYGDPGAAAAYWQQQSLEDNCGLMSVADVVGEVTGHSPTEKEIIKLAQNTPSGTNPGPDLRSRGDPATRTATVASKWPTRSCCSPTMASNRI